MASSDSSDGPVLNLINKRLRALRKKHNRILQLEESIAQGKSIKAEQEEVLRSKPSVVASIEELEKLYPQLCVAVQEEVNFATQRQQASPVTEGSSDSEASVLQDLLNVLYFGSMFDVKPQSEFTSTMLTRTHERGCCLTYDYVTDEATDLLRESDLDLIASLSGLLISRPADSNLSHKSALQQCFERAKLWLERSDQFIDSNSSFTYATLRERLCKIMASDYFTATPEMKAPVDVAAGSNYIPYEVQVASSSLQVAVEDEESSGAQYEHKVEPEANQQQHQPDIQEHLVEEAAQMVEVGIEDSGHDEHQVGADIDQRELEDPKGEEQQQYIPRKPYQNQRGGRGGGGRRGFYGGRGGRSGGRGQNGRHQYHDQQGNDYPRDNYYYINRGRGRGPRGGGGGGHSYYNNGHASSAAQGGVRVPVDGGASS